MFGTVTVLQYVKHLWMHVDKVARCAVFMLNPDSFGTRPLVETSSPFMVYFGLVLK